MQLYHGEGSNKTSSQKVFLATPAYSGVSAGYAVSLYNAAVALESAGIASKIVIFGGNCHVDDGRNTLVQKFLSSDCTDLIFLDADLWFSGDDLVKLAQHDRPVVAGVYPKKQDKTDFPVILPQGELWTEEDGLLEVYAVPTGFLKIQRHVFEEIAKSVSHYYPDMKNQTGKLTPLIFERSRNGTVRVGGDYEFCRKWKSLGGKIYVDPAMIFSHLGESAWTGNLADFLLKKYGNG